MMRGEVWWADFGLPFGHETGFIRPVVVVQHDAFNRSSIGTVVVVPLTTNLRLEEAPGNVFLRAGDTGLSKDSVAVASQVTALDRRRLREPVSKLEKTYMSDLEAGLRLVLGF